MWTQWPALAIGLNCPPVVERTEKAVGDDQGHTVAVSLKVQTHDRGMLQGASETFTRLP